MWEPHRRTFHLRFFSMIRNISESVILPIAGMVLTFIACYELIQMLIEHTGQNYLRSLFALGFQGFLIMICVGIYAVLIQNLSFSDNIISSIWGVMGYTVLLVFTLFKTGSLAKSVFVAHEGRRNDSWHLIFLRRETFQRSKPRSL